MTGADMKTIFLSRTALFTIEFERNFPISLGQKRNETKGNKRTPGIGFSFLFSLLEIREGYKLTPRSFNSKLRSCVRARRRDPSLLLFLLLLLLRFFYYTAGPNLRHLYKYILHDSPLLMASTQSAVGSNILAINKTLMGDCVAHHLVWATISNELQTAGSFTFNYSANYPSVLSSVAVSSFLPISLKETGRWKPRQKERGWLMQSQQSKLAPTRHITAQVIRLLGAQEPGKKEKERARATVRKTNRIFSPEIHTDRLVAVVRARASGIPVRHPHFPQSRANGRRRK